MEDITLAKNVEFKKGEKPNQCLVIIEPCYPGYGITLGNALRRVLLSSLPGAAVIGLKIKGANHEFMALPHIKEDVLEITMNFKRLRLKVHGDEIIRLDLNVHGEKKVTGADIKKNSQVEIINPNLVLAHITDLSGSFVAEIFVSNGRGYETIEMRENKNQEIGYIEIDSIFSPVISVGTQVENTRVGKMTDWDKLIINITTDNTITTEEAFKQSVEILIKQYSALINKKDKEEETEIKKERVKEIKEKDEKIEETEIKEVIEEKPKKKRGRPRKVANES